MKEIIRRLVEALEQYAPRDRAVTQDLIAEARKLLEGDALAQPADNDAWLKEAERLVFELATEAHLRGSLSELGPWSECGEYGELLAHLRTRPQQAGFVSVPVEPTEAMTNSALHEIDEQHGYYVTCGYIDADDVNLAYKSMIAAATKGDGK